MSTYRFVARAFPTAYWAAHGAEILHTANELHEGRWSFRESRSLLAHGLRTRSLAATGGSVQEMWMQSTALVLFVSTLGWTTTVIADQFGLVRDELAGASVTTTLLGLVTLILLTRSTRWLPMLAIILFITIVTSSNSLVPSRWLELAVIATLCIWVAVRGRSRAVMRAPTALTLAGLHVVALSFDVYLLGLFPLVLLPLGLLTARLEPRIIGSAAVSILLIFGVVLESVDDTPMSELALVFGVVSSAAAVAVALTIHGHRRLNRAI